MRATFQRLVYAGAVLAVSLLAFGPWGVAAAGMVLLFWWLWRGSELLSHALAVLVLVGLVAGLLLGPAVQLAREAAMSTSCFGHLYQLRHAIAIYDEVEGHLPPLRYDPTGTGNQHSWRVALLPYLNYDEVHRDYHFDKPWNDESNLSKLRPDLAEMFECPHHSPERNGVYLAVEGAKTVWGEGEERSLAEVTDDPGETILLIEAPMPYAAWNQPRDLTLDQAIDLLTTPIDYRNAPHWRGPGYIFKPRGVRNVIMCDRSYHSLPVPIERETAIALLTSTGGEEVDIDAIEGPEPEFDLQSIGGMALFVVVALLPMVLLWRPRPVQALSS